MIFKFLLLSDEVDDFVREICIDADASFLDLQNAILESVGYTKDQLTSFFICDDGWEKEKEITLVDMGTGSDEDSWLMEDTSLADLLEDEKQKMLFVFDNLTDRSFFMELHEIITGKELEKPVCTRSQGNAPKQLIDFEEMDKKAPATVASADMGESFYGDESFDPSEMDEEGFNNLEMGSIDNLDTDLY